MACSGERLFEIQRIRDAVAVERLLPESGRVGQSRDRLARLEMRVEYDFGHGQSAARLQGIENLAQRAFSIGNLAKHRDQQRAVKPIAGEFALPHGGFEESNVGEL